MPRARRSAHATLRIDDRALDLGRLLRGEIVRVPEVVCGSPLTGREVPLAAGELDLLLALPADRWQEVDDVPAALVEHGIVLLEAGDDELARREDALADWHPHAAAHHFLTRWRGVDVGDARRLGEVDHDEALAMLVAAQGRPPPHFHERAPVTVELPPPSVSRSLAARRTTRVFDPAPLALDDVASVLGATFGAREIATLADGIALLRKTSPSGGALHPVEAYAIVVAVEDVEPGIYHYDVERHGLAMLQPLSAAGAAELAVSVVAGQDYLGGAALYVVLAARFRRSFWKYRRHDRAYAALLLDAGHLAQTLHLVCAERGLGSFVTAALDDAAAEEALGIDGYEEGVLAVCGVGRPGSGTDPLEPAFVPYAPR